MKKKAAALLMTTVLGASFFGTSFASPGGHIGVIVDGEALQLPVAPVIQQGRTLVPIREIAEALGYTVSNPIASDLDPQVMNGRTMVPIRTIADATGAHVAWDPHHRRVTVNTGRTIDFPDQLPLPFDTIELEQVEALQAIPSNWQKKNSLRLGQVEQTELVLDLYQFSEGEVTDIHGVFSFKEQLYVLKYLNAGRDSEVRTQHVGSPLDAEDAGLGLVSVIGTEYVSQWLLFDASDQQWQVMHMLGEVVGSADDGLIAQFPGTGMNPPSAAMVRYDRDGVEMANMSEAFRSFADSHDVPSGQVVTIVQGAEGQVCIKAVLFKDGREEAETYLLDDSTLRLR